MGTNYYLDIRVNECQHCGRSDNAEPIHIGKYSAGWQFCFNKFKPTFRDWFQLLTQYQTKIIDEYKHPISLVDFLYMVVKAQKNPNYYVSNHRDYDYWDAEGYRFSKSEEFS